MPDTQTGLSEKQLRKALKWPIENFVIVVGAMKSGTSTLFDYLGQHPQIAKSRRKELNFFSTDTFEKGREFYFSRWPRFRPAMHRYALEASPSYSKDRKAARRMRKFDAEFRYVFIARNPIDRAESHVAHHIGRGRLPADIGFDHRAVAYATRVSKYAQTLDAFRTELGEPQILLLDFDELRRAPLEVAARCVAFLDLDPSFAFRPIEPVNVRRAEAAAFRFTREQRAVLAEELREDVIAFRDRYGFDVSGWGIV